MDNERALEILERVLDDLCDTQGVYETIQNLIEMGVEDDELKELKFSIEDIEKAHEMRLEEATNEDDCDGYYGEDF